MHPSAIFAHPVKGIIVWPKVVSAIEQHLAAHLAFLFLPVYPERVALRTFDDF